MKSLRTSLQAILAAAMLPIAAIAADAPKPVTGEVYAKVATKDIISRGFITSQDPYLETGATFTAPVGYLTLSTKNNLAQGGRDRGHYVGIGRSFGLPAASVTLETGQLSLPNGMNCPELYGSVTFKAPLNPKVEAVIGGKDWPGKYFSAGLSQSATLGNGYTGVLAAKLGYNDHYGNTPFSSFAHANIDASVSKILGNVHVTAGARIQRGISGHAKDDHQVYVRTAYRF